MSHPPINPAGVDPGRDAAFTPVDRRALISVGAQFFLNGAIFATYVPRFPEIRDRVDITVRDLGLLLTAAGVLGFLGSALTGRVVERFGTRRLLIGGALALVLGLMLVGFASAPVVLLAGLAVIAFFDVLVDVSMNLQGSWLSGRRHAPVMNRLHGLWSLGTVAGGLASSRIAAAGVSVQTHLILASVLYAAIVAVLSRGLLRVDEHPSLDPGAPSPAMAPRRPIAHRRLLLALLASAGAFAIAMEQTSSDWAAFRLADDFGSSAGFAGLGFVAFTAGMTTGRFTGDWLVLRLGIDRLARVAIITTAIGLAGATLVPNRGVTLAAYGLAGLGMATFFPKLYDDAAKFPGRRGAGLGAMTAGSRGAVLVTPALVGLLAGTSLSIGSAVAIVTLTALVGFAAFTIASERLRP